MDIHRPNSAPHQSLVHTSTALTLRRAASRPVRALKVSAYRPGPVFSSSALSVRPAPPTCRLFSASLSRFVALPPSSASSRSARAGSVPRIRSSPPGVPSPSRSRSSSSRLKGIPRPASLLRADRCRGQRNSRMGPCTRPRRSLPLAFTQILLYRQSTPPSPFSSPLRFRSARIRVRALLTDHGISFVRSCSATLPRCLPPPHCPYSPQTNRKAERFIQTALREWAYSTHWRNSANKMALSLPIDNYKRERPHGCLNYQPPISGTLFFLICDCLPEHRVAQ